MSHNNLEGRLVVRPFNILFAMCMAFMSCQDIGSNSPVVPRARTDKQDYNTGERVAFIISNDRTPAIHFFTCCTTVPYYVDRLDSGVWNVDGNFGLPCPFRCPSYFVVVDEGHPRVDSLFSVLDRGTYRLRIPFSIDENGTMAGELTSNTFTVQ